MNDTSMKKKSQSEYNKENSLEIQGVRDMWDK